MSRKYRILPKPFQQAPPSPEMREQVKKDLCGNTDGFVMLQTSMRFFGNPPTKTSTYTPPEEEKLVNPCTCHTYLIDCGTTHGNQFGRYELVVSYDTPDGLSEEILQIRPDQTTNAVPSLILTFYPYDVNNPNDTSYYTYSFSTTNLQWAYLGDDTGGFFSTSNLSPEADTGKWIIYNGSEQETVVPAQLCYNRYYIFRKHYSDFSFHIRTVIEAAQPQQEMPLVYSSVFHLLPVYMDPRYSNPLLLFNQVRENTLPPPYP